MASSKTKGGKYSESPRAKTGTKKSSGPKPITQGELSILLQIDLALGRRDRFEKRLRALVKKHRKKLGGKTGRSISRKAI